ncbi:hypothetical protein MTYP_00487 [Methylophilaceae bacterium]|nr:hypothetical protein MTYP_00487 [Methylophilaceae bacterium]
MNEIAVLLLLVMAVLLYRRYRQDAWHRAQSRSRVFDDCEGLLQHAQPGQDRGGLPLLRGEYAGYRVSLGIVEDTVAWRKLPPMWLLVTVHGNSASEGSLDFVARPSNNEFYSPSWQWDGNLRIPAGWPQHAILKYCRRPAGLELLNPHVPRLFADNRMKELLLTPQLLRLTYMAKQADRGEYLIMRNAVYDAVPIARAMVEPLLQQAVAMRRLVEDAVGNEKGVKLENSYA